MLTPQETVQLVLWHRGVDADVTASLILDALDAAGYLVVRRKELLDMIMDNAEVAS